MTITLPDEMRDDLEARAKACGYATVDEYVQDRVELDEEPEFELTDEMHQRLIELAEEGINSGPAVDAQKFLDELGRRLRLGLDISDLRR